MFSAFALILAALQRAPAAPVAAVRETGVVIATGMAALILHERVTGQRLAGAFVVVVGVALIALGSPGRDPRARSRRSAADRASQTRRPCQMSRCGKRAQSARGTSRRGRARCPPDPPGA